MLRAAFVAVLLCMIVPAVAAEAQQVEQMRIAPEVRADAILADRQTVQGGLGVNITAGYYARVAVIAGAGADIESGFATPAARLDIVARFLLDPFRQAKWGLSIGGGVSLRVRDQDRVRPYLLTVVDLEGPRIYEKWSPAIQLGLGGGVRVGFGVRRGAERYR